MRKYVQKGISLALVMTMSTWCLSGCGTTNTQSKKTEKKQKEASETIKQSDLQTLLSSKIGDTANTEKKETVFVEMDPSGEVTKTTVSDTLKVSDKDSISDVSNLDNITNLSGDEKYTTDENGNIVWENKGKDITYQGTTTESTPIKVNVKYYLDDEEISPDDLAGKSGKVKIVYDYVNETSSEGKFIPFITLTGMVLDDNFTNVKVDNGKVVEYDGSNIVIGYGAPGFKDNLISTVSKAEDYLKDIDIPESFTVEADVKDFSLNMSLTMATSEIADLDLDKSLDFSDIEDKMDELKDGTNQLVKGAGDLVSGAGELNSGADKIDKGAKDIAKYTSDLYLGTTTLLTSYKKFDSALVSGVKSANKGAKKLYKGTKSVKSASNQLNSGAQTLNSGAKKVNSGAQELAKGLSSAKAGFEDVKDSKGNVKSQGLKNGSKALATGTKTAETGVKQLVGTLQSTPSSIQTQIDGVVKKVSAATGGAIASEKALNATIEKINGAIAQGADMTTVLTGAGLNATAYYQLLEAYYGIKTLEQVKSTFETQITSQASSIKALVDGMGDLTDAASALNTGINTLYTGISKLNTGAGTLTAGTKSLYDGTSTLASGTNQLNSGAKTLNLGMKSLSQGTDKMNSKLGDASSQVKDGIATVNSGAGQISDGAKTLANGTGSLSSGVVTLFNGTKTLKDGVVKLNDEGISKITEIFGDDTKDAVNSIEDILNNGKEYKSFSGIKSDMSGNVKFIFKTAEIKSDK